MNTIIGVSFGLKMMHRTLTCAGINARVAGYDLLSVKCLHRKTAAYQHLPRPVGTCTYVLAKCVIANKTVQRHLPVLTPRQQERSIEMVDKLAECIIFACLAHSIGIEHYIEDSVGGLGHAAFRCC